MNIKTLITVILLTATAIIIFMACSDEAPPCHFEGNICINNPQPN